MMRTALLSFLALAISALCLGSSLHAVDAPATETPESTATEPTATSEAETKKPRVAFLHINEMIDPWQARYVQRAVDDAIANKVDYIITHIDTNGGRLDSALEIFNTFLNIDGEDKPRCIAFIDQKAYSAGALIAFSHHDIYMTRTASIGDIGVIFQTPEGKIEYAPEKMVSVVRTELIKAANLRGWDAAWLQKMTDRNQKLYEIRHNADKKVFVIEENLNRYLADNPEIDRENEKQVFEHRGEDRLITVAGDDALTYNMATDLVKNLDGLYEKLGADKSQEVNLSPTNTESTARYLGSFAPLLLGATVMLIVFEMKTAGVGLFAGLACITGTLYFICNFYQNLATYYEVLLIAIGILLVIIEMFTMIGGGFLAIIGALVAFAGIFLSFMPNAGQFDFDNIFYGDYINSALLNSVLTLFVMSVALVLFIYAAPRLPIFQRLAVQAEISGTSEGALSEEEEALVGKSAKALTQLRPSGQVIASNGKADSATVKHGGFVDQDGEVIITDHRYGELIVEPKEPEVES